MKPIISVNASVSTSAPTVLPKGMDSWHYANYMNLISRNAGGGDHFDARQMGYIKRYYDDPKIILRHIMIRRLIRMNHFINSAVIQTGWI